MFKLLIIDTGGTFNKVYNPITGELDIKSGAINEILESVKDNIDYRVVEIIGKDSLYINNSDREKIVNLINSSVEDKILIIHGTDTIVESAEFIEKRVNRNLSTLFTGAMRPFSIDRVEASLNIGLSIGFLERAEKGVYISMSGLIRDFRDIEKDRNRGVFKAIN